MATRARYAEFRCLLDACSEEELIRLEEAIDGDDEAAELSIVDTKQDVMTEAMVGFRSEYRGTLLAT